MSVSLNKLVAVRKALEEAGIASAHVTNGRPLTVAPQYWEVAAMKGIAARFGRDCRPVKGSHCWEIFNASDEVDAHYETAIRAAGNRPVSPSEE